MYATVEWKKNFETGIEDIDLQHHYFLNLINHIIEAIGQREEKRFIEALVAELNAYAKFHFTSEERMMLYSNYPDYELHKNHHLDLIQRLSVKQYNLINASDEEDTDAIIEFLVSWFVDHTTSEDKLFADYLHSKHRDDRKRGTDE